MIIWFRWSVIWCHFYIWFMQYRIGIMASGVVWNLKNLRFEIFTNCGYQTFQANWLMMIVLKLIWTLTLVMLLWEIGTHLGLVPNSELLHHWMGLEKTCQLEGKIVLQDSIFRSGMLFLARSNSFRGNRLSARVTLSAI